MRCPAVAGQCEKEHGHEDGHYTTYRDGVWAAPRAEGLDVERLARAIKSRYGLKESESEVSIFLNAIFGSGEAGHD